jgi:hypothetical protein
MVDWIELTRLRSSKPDGIPFSVHSEICALDLMLSKVEFSFHRSGNVQRNSDIRVLVCCLKGKVSGPLWGLKLPALQPCQHTVVNSSIMQQG